MSQRRETSRTAHAGRLLMAGVVLLAGIAAANGRDEPALETDMRCDIEASRDEGTLRVQGVVHAEDELQGVYELEVRAVGGSGSSSIRQSGQFSASPGLPEYLGQVQFGGTGASYEAKLTLRFEKGELVCDKHIGG